MAANTILTSTVTGGSNSHATTAEEANAWATDFVSQGVVGTISANVGSGGSGSFCVNADASPDMGVTIKAGQAYITATPSGQNSQVLRARATTDYTTYVINANASGSTKYDWIYLSVSAVNANTPSADASNVASFVTSRSSSNTSDNGTPPTYGILLAVITVANGASSITNSVISDRRTVSSLSTVGTASTTGWNSLGYTPSTVTANGNRSYSCVFSSVDLSGTLSAGMRLRTTRVSQAPTQSTSLNGTTQYYSKTAPAGMTFTNNFVVSAWVKLASYNGAFNIISSRYNGTSGWYFYLNTSGQVVLTGANGGGANTFVSTSYQSVPLNKWVHVAAQLDMTTTSVGTTNNYIMIDGVEVPNSVARAGTNPTALVQAGNLEIGSVNGGTSPFNGKLAQVAIYSAKVTEATIQASISQGLAGTETNLISAYSFNNSINDLNTTNANNLTANGSAVATATDSPFGGQAGGAISSTLDYGIIQSVAFSTNTTVVVQVPEGCTIPTSGGVSAVSYSTVDSPYGFPKDKNKWRISSILKTNSATTSNATYGSYLGGGYTLTIPIGAWDVGHQGSYYNNTVTAVYFNISSTPLTGLAKGAGQSTSPFAVFTQSPAAATGANTAYIRQPQTVSSQVAYVMYTVGATTAAAIEGDGALAEIFAENAYL